MKIRIKDQDSIPTFIETSEVIQLFKVVFKEFSNKISDYKKKSLIRDITILELLFATVVTGQTLLDNSAFVLMHCGFYKSVISSMSLIMLVNIKVMC